MRTIETKVYKFNELSETAKEKAIEYMSDTNVNYEWWEFIYTDAEDIGLKLTGFDMDRYCHGKFTQSAEDVANNIIKNHGKDCETYKDAYIYLTELTTLKNIHSVADMEDEDIDTSEIDKEFLNTLLEDYRIMLRKEYEYLTSKEAIVETIEANDYEFTEDGKLS